MPYSLILTSPQYKKSVEIKIFRPPPSPTKLSFSRQAFKNLFC